MEGGFVVRHLPQQEAAQPEKISPPDSEKHGQ